MTSWHSYPKVYNIGHPQIASLFDDTVIVEEKVDGSQFSFGVFYEGPDNTLTLKCRSKGKDLILDAPEKMFQKAIDTAISLVHLLKPGWTYRAEYLEKPKHNVLAYDRVPTKHLIIFDINVGEETYLERYPKLEEACRLGLECVPSFPLLGNPSVDLLREILEHRSILGGQKLEGIVVKNYQRFGADKKVLIGKHVSESFKEVHQGEWRKQNPTGTDIKQELAAVYRTPARWAKAVQHLRDSGRLENSPRDIGMLIKEVGADITEECSAEIKQRLYDWAWPHIQRGVIAGLPEWYKQQLLESAFT